MSYGMPTLKVDGQALVYFTASKKHMSFYPSSGPVEALKDRLGGYTTTQHAIQFTLENPLPEALLKELTLFHLREIEAE